MSDTTRIHDLPTDPMNGGTNMGVGMGGTNMGVGMGGTNVGGNIPSEKPEVALDQSTINQIVSSLQQATTSGLTQLPSRDIPTTVTQDPYIQANYIPPPIQRDYIQEESNQDIIQKEAHYESVTNRLEHWYKEIQFPILIAVLFFLFQLPILKTLLFRYFPIMFFKDGNINIYGLLFLSFSFSIVYSFLFKLLSII